MTNNIARGEMSESELNPGYDEIDFSSLKVSNNQCGFVRHFQRRKIHCEFPRVALVLLASPRAILLVAVGDIYGKFNFSNNW